MLVSIFVIVRFEELEEGRGLGEGRISYGAVGDGSFNIEPCFWIDAGTARDVDEAVVDEALGEDGEWGGSVGGEDDLFAGLGRFGAVWGWGAEPSFED